MSHSSASAKGWEPPSIEELSAQLPQYQIEALLGRGGMGAVYEGRQTSLDRPVAIKILSGALEDSDAGFTERFKNEARAMGKLNHPGIVGVYDFGQTGTGLLYIVMEYVDGTDVSRMIAKKGRLHTEHAMAITAHVCDALAYAHERGIIHRDIKPANIMVGYDGVVKVADFGLAKMTQSQNSGLTQSGMAMGTLHYMAPEALTLGSAVDQRADIYAVGVMLYQMLTGKLPQGMFEMPSLQITGLDPRYDKIVATAMRDDRELRYASARALRLELDAILTQPVVKVEASAKEAPAALNTQARPKRPEWQPPQPVTMPPARQMKRSLPYASILLATLCVAAGWIYWQQSDYRLVVEPSHLEETAKGQTSPAIPAASKESPFVNTLGMKFVPVPGTKVLFCMHETRRQDYAAYANEVPGVDGSWKTQEWDGIPCGDKEGHPVVGVNWEDAQAFCAWLSKKEGKTYRLPTDEEWSIAVGLGGKEKHGNGITPDMLHRKEQSIYPWEKDYPPEDNLGNYADESLHAKMPQKRWIEKYSDGYVTTAPVMSFKPNKLGLYDLGGNVWEIVEDWFDAKKTTKTCRGHSHINTPGFASDRASAEKKRSMAVGFRCVVSALSTPATVESPATPAAGGKARAAVSGNSATPQSFAGTVTIPSIPPVPSTKDEPFINTLGMKFVPVPITGGPTSGQQVLFSVWETRVQDFEAFVKDSGLSLPKPDVEQGPTHAVAGVSWEDAQAFCKWLTKMERASGKIRAGESYRLPSDHEWSCAVGIGEEEDATKLPIEKDGKVAGLFPWGNQWPPPVKWGNFWSEELRPLLAEGKYIYSSRAESPGYIDGQATSGPVGSYQANHLGLYDLWGNVWEWCGDWYDSANQKYVLRGLSWREAASSPQISSARGTCPPSARVNRHGFRCVLSPVASIAAQAIGTSGTTMSKAAATKSAAKAAPATNATYADTVLLPQGPTTWTDVKGRSLVATFKSVQGDAVLLEIAGKTQPVALATLSEGSQKLARAYQSRAGPMAATKDKLFTNTLGMKFVPVPDTNVLFCIHETRWQDYAAYAAEHAGIDSTWKNQSYDGYALTERKEQHPVTQVSWEDAEAFCAWLSKKEGKIYRLPTDSEWSIAIGIGHLENWAANTMPVTVFKDQKEFPWGPYWPPTNGSGNYSDESRKAKAPSAKASYLEGYEDLFPTTAPVMSFRPNKLGIYDLDGNVREWVQEWYDDSKKYRGLRGGSWVASDREGLLSSSRTRVRSEARYNDIGFRVVLANDADQPYPAKTVGPVQAAPSPGSSATSKSSGGATLTSQGQMTRALTSGAAPPPAPLLSSTGISSAVDAIKQSETDKKTCLKRFLALSEQTKGTYSFKLQNEIRHCAVDIDRTAELAACNEIFANQRMQPYIISILDGTLAPGQKNAPAKHATQAKQVALEARAFPFVRAACLLRAGELLSGLGRFDEAAASYKQVLEMPEEKLSAYKELAKIRLEGLPK